MDDFDDSKFLSFAEGSYAASIYNPTFTPYNFSTEFLTDSWGMSIMLAFAVQSGLRRSAHRSTKSDRVGVGPYYGV